MLGLVLVYLFGLGQMLLCGALTLAPVAKFSCFLPFGIRIELSSLLPISGEVSAPAESCLRSVLSKFRIRQRRVSCLVAEN